MPVAVEVRTPSQPEPSMESGGSVEIQKRRVRHLKREEQGCIPSGSTMVTSSPSLTEISPAPFALYAYSIFPRCSIGFEVNELVRPLDSSAGISLMYWAGGGGSIRFFGFVFGLLIAGRGAFLSGLVSSFGVRAGNPETDRLALAA